MSDLATDLQLVNVLARGSHDAHIEGRDTFAHQTKTTQCRADLTEAAARSPRCVPSPDPPDPAHPSARPT